jgi:hypothetical protein
MIIGIGIPFGRRGGIVQSFKSRVTADSGTFEAESCLNSSINNLRNLNLLNSASLLLTPNAYKVSKMYSIIPNTGAGDFTFSRASTAMRRNASGVWESVANNVPRLHYPVGGGCPSWLNEPQRTNVILHSNDFSQSVWAPANSLNIVRGVNSIIADATNGNHRLAQGSVSITTNGTISFFVKPNGYSKIGVRDGNTGNYCSFHLSGAGSILQNSGFTTPAITYDSVSDLYYITVSLTASSVNPQLYILDPSYTTGPITGSWIGDNSSGILLYYFQVESGLFATSPIITAGSALTRLADDVILSGTANSFVTPTAFTLFFDIEFDVDNFASRFTINNASATNIVFLGLEAVAGTNLGFRATIRIGGVDALSQTINVSAGRHKGALVFNASGGAWFLDGVKRNTYASVASGSFDNISVARDFFSAVGNQNKTLVNLAMIHPIALSDAECIALTT